MGIFFKKKNGGFSDVIRCDEPDYVVWKWHPSGANQGELKRETAIRTNSILRVKPGELAVFFYKQGNGTLVDYIVGPHDEKLKTKNFPALSSIIGLWYEGDTPFQAEVFFINLAKVIQIKFGVPYFNVVDPRYPDFEVPVAVRGTINFKIEDYKDFILCHQLINFDLETLKSQVKDSVIRYIKEVVANAPAENNIPVINIESKIDLITEKAEINIKDRLLELYGITVTGLDISAIEIDKESESYAELRSITKELTKRQAEANVLNYEEQLRIQREEGQYATRMATRTQNIGAYETQVKGEVGIAGAEALGKMGENGAGNVNFGGGEFNPMTIMAGMAVGSAVGQNIAGTMGQAMNPQPSQVPPKIPTVTYFVAKDNNPSGPFEISQLITMISTGEFNKDSLVWKQGMQEWQKAESIEELSKLFPPKI